MPNADLHTFAEQLARVNGRGAMVPVIEKELLHYEILTALEEAGLLSKLTFQGGTCLRLCYGARRYSEDLDFVGGGEFNAQTMEQLQACLESSLAKEYSLIVKVQKPPAKEQLVKKWRITIDTSPSRPDLPSQKISFEVASVPAYTRELRMLQLNYEGLSASYEDILVECESLEEILADKLESFICSKHIRYRDIWDLQWLSRRPTIEFDEAYRLRKHKETDYGESNIFAVRLPQIIDGLESIIESPDFLSQMKRFLPVDEYERTIARPDYRSVLLNSIRDLYAPLS